MAQSPSLPDQRPLQLMVIDEDAVFRSGLRIWLEQFADLRIAAEVEDGDMALQILANSTPSDIAALDIATSDTAPTIDLVVLDLNLGQRNRSQPAGVATQGLEVCRQIRLQYPGLPILILSVTSLPVLVAAAQRAGATGFCSKATEVTELITAIRQVANRRSFWQNSTAIVPSSPPPLLVRSPARLPRFFNTFRRNLRESGICQIEAALADTNEQLHSLTLSDLDRAVLAGRQRELRAARKLVNLLLPVEISSPSPPPRTPLPSSPPPAPASPPNPASPLLSSAPASAPSLANLQAIVFDAVLSRLQTSLENGTDIPLEIDILQEDRKRELFYLILRKLEDVLTELRYSQVEAEQLDAMRSTILIDLWQATAIDFFGKYYTVSINDVEVVVIDAIFAEVNIVQIEILDKIPGVVALFSHFLFQTPLLVNGTPYASGNPEAVNRAEMLLENLLIQIANAVIQPILNQFARVEAIKQKFYDRRLLSNREIERFRNDLSWRYRVDELVREPKDIFESKFSLFVFSDRGIRKTTIYAPRTQELEQLSGIPYFITLTLETRDAIAPRLRSVVALVGNSLVYVLTEVIGRGIGLVGRGIVKGIGNVWQDGRFDRK